MNNLFATWRSAADVDLTAGEHLDVAELLSRAHDQLAGIPELSHAAHLVEIALDDVLAWFDGDVSLRLIRSTSSAGSR
jgi:hypothetical protein